MGGNQRTVATVVPEDVCSVAAELLALTRLCADCLGGATSSSRKDQLAACPDCNTKILELVETLAAMCVTECAPNFINEYMCTVASTQMGSAGCDMTDMLGYIMSFSPESTMYGGYYMTDQHGYYGYGFSSSGYYSYYQ